MRPTIIRTAEALEVLRAVWNVPITVISWYRTPAHNRKVDGAKNSRHLQGDAVDIVVAGISPKAVADKVDELQKSGALPRGGLGRYPTFTHLDLRGRNARWASKKPKESK